MTRRAAEQGPESRSEDELEELRARVLELEATIAAVSRGDVDALVVNDESGKEQLYTLRGADTPYQLLIEQMQEGALSLDREGMILYANRRFAEMLGVPLERVIGSRLGSFAATTQGAILRDLLSVKCQPGESTRREVRFVHASGGRFPAYVSISALSEENHVCAVVTDLTEHKRAEQIAVSERKHRMMSAVHDAVRATSAGTGLAERLLRAMAEQFGASRALLAWIDPQAACWIVEHEHARSGLVPITGQPSACEWMPAELVAELAAGRTIAVRDVESDPRLPASAREELLALRIGSFACVPEPPGEALVRVLALLDGPARTWSATDLSLFEQGAERVWGALSAEFAAERLRESEGRFRQLADTIPQLAWMARPDGWIYWYNSRWYEYTGATIAEMEGWGWQSLHDPALLPKVLERWRASLADGEAFQMEFPLRGADGSYRAFLTQAVPLRDAKGDVVQWFGTNTDVTSQHRMMEERQELLAAERIARGEAERVSQMKDEFVATLSHELRTPLNAILGWTQLLAHAGGTGVDLKEGLATIERNARVQVQMIEDLLDVSRITSGKLLLQPQRVGFCSVVEGAIASVRPAADVKEIRIHQLLDERADAIHGDPNRLQQVVWNLLTNAVKFTSKGGRIVVLLTRAESQAVLSVSDNGVGIAPEFLPHVFERFRQADGSTTREFAGLGLGLSIVKQLVELHGGSIQARSAGKGTGATFIVSLPLSPERHGVLARGEETVRTSELSATLLDGLTVVYIDDDPDAGELVRRVLTDRGARVFIGKSAGEARQLIVRERPHVMVTDIGMPGEDGYSLIRSVRAMADEQVSRTPAAAVTALARTEDRQRALLAGFQTHVAKPVEPNELVAVVASLAGRTSAGMNAVPDVAQAHGRHRASESAPS